MSIQPPQGILNIPNATLRVGKLEVNTTEGLDTVLNNIERNTILLEDSTEYPTTEEPVENEKRWGLKTPNIFVATFEIEGAGSSFNFRNTSNGDATTGYTLTFSGTTLTLKYDNASLTTATIPTLDSTYGKVYLTYEKQHFTVTVDGTLVLTYKDATTRTPPEGEYANFFAGTGSPGFKNLKVVAGHFISDGTSNVSLFGGLAVTSNLEVGSSNLFVDTQTSRVGVGTNTPKEALDVVGNMHLTRVSNVSQIKVDSNVVTEYTGPHDRPLRKYPEVAMTANSDSGYVASASSTATYDTNLQPENAFNSIISPSSATSSWQSSDSGYSGTTPFNYLNSGTHTVSLTDTDGTIHRGDWLSLQTPNRIKVSYYKIHTLNDVDNYRPDSFVLLGSNSETDGTWKLLHTETSGMTDPGPEVYTGHVNSTEFYTYHRLLVKSLAGNGGEVYINELEYYGYEEGSGSLDTTLKSVYNVPATTGTQLEVYYDAKDLTTMPSTVTDLSPNTNNGTLYGDPQVSNGAFVFDGTGDAVISGATSFSGSPTLSYSVWSKTNSILDNGSNSIVAIGYADIQKSLGFRIKHSAETNPGSYRFYIFGGATNESVDTSFIAPFGIWTHVTVVYDGLNMKIYVNGKFTLESTNTSTNLNLDSSTKAVLGNYIDSNGNVSTTYGDASYDGSIANFRLYSKALNADQVKELYDYQKDYFLGTHSSVTLHKGRFGVGTKEPMKELDVVGDVGISANLHMTTQSSVLVNSNVVTEYTGPHDRPLRKYPEVTLTSASQGGYVASASTVLGLGWEPYRAFNTIAGGGEGWHDVGSTYSAGVYTGINSVTPVTGGDVEGEWIQIQLPEKIKLEKVRLAPRETYTYRMPKDATILGSINGTDWYIVTSWSGQTYTSGNNYTTINVDSEQYYNYYVLVVEALEADAGGNSVNIGEWELYGHEEGSASLDTTLKSVYNVPATTGTQLEVYYDGQDYSVMPTVGSASVTDKAGGDQTGTPGTGVSFDSTYKAFVFDGSANGKIVGTHNLSGTAPVNTCSAWFKKTSSTGNYSYISRFGTNATSSQIAISIDERTSTLNKLRFEIFGGSTALESELTITENVWYHVAGVYSGGTWNTNNCKLYLNGVEISLTNGTNTTTTPSITDTTLVLGSDGNSNSWDLDGSIANFRLYSKALNADQVKELYDYQKDYFLGSKSQVTLYKGHLGVGVTEPSGQLELAGDERLQEYPPGPMGRYDYETLIPGHGVFCAYASVDSSPHYYPGGVFDKTPNIFYWDPGSGGARYSTSSPGNYLKSNRLAAETVLGEYLVLKLPYKIKLDSFSIARQNSGWWVPQEIIYYAKSEEEDLWEQIHSHGSIMGSYSSSGNSADGTDAPIHREVKSTKFYRYFALVITKSNGGGGTSLNEWRLFGTPGPTTLDKGSLTLGRSLDVPRVSRYDVDTETPRPEKLVVDFDTTVNSSPTDISGQGNHGAFYGTNMKYSSADKAFVFNGTDDYIETSINIGSGGNIPICISVWVKYNADGWWFWLGDETTPGGIGVESRSSGTRIRFVVRSGNYVEINSPGYNMWNHYTFIHTGSTTSDGRMDIYMNGVFIEPVDSRFNYATTNITNNNLRVGDRSSSPNFNGQISNFKMYGVGTTLEPSEVKKLYNLGRTGRSMVISDTAVGIGKVPEANLDVRGSLAVRGGNVMIEQDNIKVRLASDPGYLSQIQGGSMYIANPSTSGGYEHFIMNNSTTGTHQTTYFSFRRDNTQIGSILTSTGSTISFNTGSDYRLKENIVDMPDVGLEIINKLRPKTFNFKKYPGETVHGFIAHELQEHIPIAVSGEKDEMRGEEPMYQGVDASKIVPWLVKSIQELYEENQTLKTRLDTLEGA